MDKELAVEEMIETIREFGQCSVFLADDDEIAISPATDYIGGEEGYYMCDALGNIQYSNIEEICEDVMDFIDDREILHVEVD